MNGIMPVASTGFDKLGFIEVLSMNHKLVDNWFFGMISPLMLHFG
jgi:hypothetical protein